MVTNDKGFAGHVEGFYNRNEFFCGVIFAPASLGIGPTLQDLYLMAEVMEPQEMHNVYYRLPI